MIFGDKNSFAIECEFTHQIEEFLYGKFRVWVDHQALGTFSEEVITLLCTTGVLRKSVRNATPLASELSAQAFLDMVWETCYGSGGYDEQEHQKWGHYVWFDSCEGFENTRSVIAQTENGVRIVWQLQDEQSASERFVPERVYSVTVSKFTAWFDKQIMEKAQQPDGAVTQKPAPSADS
jgi:hypothetical protein